MGPFNDRRASPAGFAYEYDRDPEHRARHGLCGGDDQGTALGLSSDATHLIAKARERGIAGNKRDRSNERHRRVMGNAAFYSSLIRCYRAWALARPAQGVPSQSVCTS
jgi:hypothetical protein